MHGQQRKIEKEKEAEEEKVIKKPEDTKPLAMEAIQSVDWGKKKKKKTGRKKEEHETKDDETKQQNGSEYFICCIETSKFGGISSWSSRPSIPIFP